MKTFWANQGIAVIRKTFYLRVLNVGLLCGHSLNLSLLFSDQEHWLFFWHSFFCHAVNAPTNHFRQPIRRGAAATSFDGLYFFGSLKSFFLVLFAYWRLPLSSAVSSAASERSHSPLDNLILVYWKCQLSIGIFYLISLLFILKIYLVLWCGPSSWFNLCLHFGFFNNIGRLQKFKLLFFSHNLCRLLIYFIFLSWNLRRRLRFVWSFWTFLIWGNLSLLQFMFFWLDQIHLDLKLLKVFFELLRYFLIIFWIVDYKFLWLDVYWNSMTLLEIYWLIRHMWPLRADVMYRFTSLSDYRNHIWMLKKIETHHFLFFFTLRLKLTHLNKRNKNWIMGLLFLLIVLFGSHVRQLSSFF